MQAARRGVLIKGAQYLERLARADTIVCDKTGTLTRGTPEIVSVACADGLAPRELVALCAGLEARQNHPVAAAVRRYAARRRIAPREPDAGSEAYVVGLGLAANVRGQRLLLGSPRWMRERGADLSAMGPELARHRRRKLSSLLVALDGRVVGALAYADPPWPESAAVVRALKASGRRSVVLLSGDERGVVANLGRALGVDVAIGEMLPEDEARHVRALQRQGRVVAMVGDGINDAPALAAADVGVSMRGSAEAALETADVVLLDDGLDGLLLAFEASDDAMASVRRGLRLVIAPNAAAIVLGALGLMNPAAAAAVNNGSTVLAAVAALAKALRRPRARPQGGRLAQR